MKKPHISIEAFHKLNRSKLLAHSIYLDLKTRPLDGMHNLYIPTLFCYLNEDICDVLEELKSLGLCDEWLKQKTTKNN